eukprot:scaffold1828_cov258-Pinguiococcus_pyrenoidosus.AAC.6
MCLLLCVLRAEWQAHLEAPDLARAVLQAVHSGFHHLYLLVVPAVLPDAQRASAKCYSPENGQAQQAQAATAALLAGSAGGQTHATRGQRAKLQRSQGRSPPEHRALHQHSSNRLVRGHTWLCGCEEASQRRKVGENNRGQKRRKGSCVLF